MPNRLAVSAESANEGSGLQTDIGEGLDGLGCDRRRYGWHGAAGEG
jgi:hypothetical protein